MPSTKKQGRMRILAVLLALCLLFVGCVASSVPEPVPGPVPEPSEPLSSAPAEETETTSVPEGSAPEGSTPEASIPEGSMPDGSTCEGPTSEEGPSTSLPEGSVPPADVPLEQPESIDSDDPELLSVLDELTALAEEYGLSVSYISGDGGYAFSVNGDAVHQSASTIKAMYCEYLLEAGFDWQEEILFDIDVPKGNSSDFFTPEKRGSSFTLGELIGYTLRYSDNIAYRLLVSVYGRDNYNAWVKDLGIPGLTLSGGGNYITVNADDLSLGMLEILRYSQQDRRVVELLLDAEHKTPIVRGTPYAVACKYGFWGGATGYHGTAIVYAPAPYVLTVMSKLNPDNPGETAPFAEVTKLTDQLNQRLFQYEP